MAKKLKSEGKENQTSPTHTVISDFRSIENFNQTHYAGEDVSHFAPERLEHLVKTGMVKKEE